MNPLLRWAGSKKQLVPILASHWSEKYQRYVEPFAGSGVLFFSIKPNTALIGDINKELIDTYLSVKYHAIEVAEELSHFKLSEKEYYRVRSLALSEIGRIERAARFIFLNRFCFNGLYRTNNAGNFNVPFGGIGRTGKLPTFEFLTEVARMLKGATLVAGDFQKVLDQTKSGDFVYLDPPYVNSESRTFIEYGPEVFTEADLERLSEQLETMQRNRVTFLLSYKDCVEARKIFKEWKISTVTVRRNIAGFSGARKYSNEILVTNGKV
jgi:DNA adenine methylase